MDEINLDPLTTHLNRNRGVIRRLADNHEYLVNKVFLSAPHVPHGHRQDIGDALENQSELLIELAETIDALGKDIVYVMEHLRNVHTEFLEFYRKHKE